MASPFNILSNELPTLPWSETPPSTHPRPPWLRVRFFGGPNYQELKRIMRTLNRDDQTDGGAAIFARTITEIRQRVPGCKVEVLIPDFRGVWPALETVVAAQPDVLNHNTETVPRLYRQVRRGAVYERSLELLRRAKELSPQMPTKTGLMLGLGEQREEVLATMRDLVAQGTDILTLGQYLQPTKQHMAFISFVHPDEFAEYKQLGERMGFKHVEAGPLVRSSYHAFEQEQAARC